MVGVLRKVIDHCRKASAGLKAALFPHAYYVYPRSVHEHHRLSYSQEGEDLFLASYFQGKSHGYFVDVGAFHPQRYSNTYLFYLHGWRGINIDARPGSMAEFNRVRSQDVNLEYSVSDAERELIYYQFNEPALNGFDENIAKTRDGSVYRIISKERLTTRTLAQILDAHLPQGQEIDFLSVDVEGLDEQVLRSNDWNKYRPHAVLTEDLKQTPLDRLAEHPTVCFLKEQGYSLYAKMQRNLLFTAASVLRDGEGI